MARAEQGTVYPTP